jgi:hypothetical protein
MMREGGESRAWFQSNVLWKTQFYNTIALSHPRAILPVLRVIFPALPFYIITFLIPKAVP